MLSLANPAWLGVLALLPLLRWLHRGGAPRPRWVVAHLPLWRAAAAGQAEAAAAALDPAWRRRAALLALLGLALAGPQWLAPARPRVTLWLADSASLALLEEGGQRRDAQLLALAGKRLEAERPDAEVQWRRLSDPWSTEFPPQVVPPEAAASAPPPVELLDPGREHWWLGDASDPRLQQWARPPARALRLGRERAANAGWRQALARRAADGSLLLTAELANGGAQPEERVAQVWVDGRAQGVPRPQTLAVGEGRWLQWQVPAGSRELELRLEPADALPGDDRLVLDLRPLRRRTLALDPACPDRLRDAVLAHPGLRSVPAAADAELRLRCAGPDQAAPGLLRWHSGGAQGPAQPVLGVEALRTWLPERLAPTQVLDLAPQDGLLLAAGTQPLAVRRAAGGIELAIDPAVLPELPLLLDALLVQLHGEALLDPLVQSAVRRVEVRPGPVPATQAVAGAVQTAPRSLALPFVLAALALLVWELGQLGRRLRRIGR